MDVTWVALGMAVAVIAAAYFLTGRKKTPASNAPVVISDNDNGPTAEEIVEIKKGLETDGIPELTELAPTLTTAQLKAAKAEAAEFDAKTPNISKNKPSAKLLKMTKSELLAEAEKQGVTANTRMKKADILKKLK